MKMKMVVDRAKLLMSKCDPTHSATYENIKSILLKELPCYTCLQQYTWRNLIHPTFVFCNSQENLHQMVVSKKCEAKCLIQMFSDSGWNFGVLKTKTTGTYLQFQIGC